MLLEKFGFGWQVVNLSGANTRFATQDITSYGVSPVDAHKLLNGIVPGINWRGCANDCRDHGNANDIEEVRELMLYDQNEAIAPVIVSSNWAMLEWWGTGGGEALFTKEKGVWKKVSGGGGCMNMIDLQRYGVPASVAQRFQHTFPCGPISLASPKA